MLFGVYTTELFPTEVRLRGNGVCNTVGRAATIVSPFIVVSLFQSYGIFGVIGLLIILLIMQIIAITTLGVEPAGLGLEEVDAQAVKA
jgi:putative MFS transporter